MIKRILFIAFCALLAAPAYSAAGSETASDAYMVATDSQPRVSINGQNLRVQGAAGADVEIYNITGVRVAVKHIENNDQTLQLNLQRGCYIVKIGKFVRKISVL